jgi:Uma2 family endonuclease
MSAVLTPQKKERVVKPVKLKPPEPEDLSDLSAMVVRLGPLKNHVTDDEFFEFCMLNRDLRIEMTSEGVMIIAMGLGSEGGGREFSLIGEFAAWGKADGTGIGFSSSAIFALPNGAKRSPDVSWIRRERWEAIPKDQREKFALICPDFVVELRSRTDRLKQLKQKMEEYRENGAQLGWLIDPLKKKVYVYRPNEEVEELDSPSSISGEPLLKGFTLELSGIFD